METHTVVDYIGWTGAACLLLAYWLVSSGRVPGRSWTYQLLNVTGAVLLSVNSGYYGAFPSVGLNIVWIMVGITTLRALRMPSADVTKL